MKSTIGIYLPGVGGTITRANINAEQFRRVEAGKKPATPEEIVNLFIPFNTKPRHLKRATALMKGRSWVFETIPQN